MYVCTEIARPIWVLCSAALRRLRYMRDMSFVQVSINNLLRTPRTASSSRVCPEDAAADAPIPATRERASVAGRAQSPKRSDRVSGLPPPPPPWADLRGALEARATALAADGWHVEDIPYFCAFFFADRGPDRIHVGSKAMSPGTHRCAETGGSIVGRRTMLAVGAEGKQPTGTDYMPDNYAIEWTQFSVNCPKCKSLARPTLQQAQRSPKTTCSTCGATIDLDTPEAKQRQSEAAMEAMKRAVKDAGG